MAPGYVEYLEKSAARVPIAGVASLAQALNTSVDELLGGPFDVPSGRRGQAPHPELEVLSEEECAQLLAAGGVGRFVFTTDRGPIAVPVNYRVMDGDVVFRVDASTTLATVPDSDRVSFEVDHVDEAMSTGWSVLVTGRVRRVSPDEFRRLEDLGIEPWAGGQRSVFLRIERRHLSGRRIRRNP
jgi:nitroimidazol reductase NimA-like FMN-containing flavoprotein (pyridoxamine 5'-phosphate oxidase superfamily)